MNFKNWNEAKIKKEELNLYTKTWLKEMSLKPKKTATSEQHKVFTDGRWKTFEFYKIEDTEEIRKRNKPIIKDIEINIDTICQSLYLINKSAKKSRDSKNKNYYNNYHGIVARCKGRQQELYELKQQVIDKMIKENILSFKGYHNQDSSNIKLLLYVVNDYSFHVPTIEDIKSIEYLGEIGTISSAVERKINIKFTEAVNTLNKYLELNNI